MDKTVPQGPLSGLTVVELASDRAAYCGKLIADLGSRVILVEPEEGHSSRTAAPLMAGSTEPFSLGFAYMNAGKLGISLDLMSEKGRDDLKRLVSQADVLIDPFGPGYLEEKGFGYKQLAASNQKLIVASVTGFGLTGPKRDFRTSNLIAYAMGGVMSLNGYEDTPPLMPDGNPAYSVASMNTAIAITVALYHRQFTNRGRHIDISLQESVAQLTNWTGVSVYLYDKLLRTRSSVPPGSTPVGNYRCKNGYISIQIARPGHWDVLADWIYEMTGVRDVLDDSLRGPAMRRLNRVNEINDWTGRLCAKYLKEEFVAEGQRRHLPVASVATPLDLVNSPQLAYRKYWVNLGIGGADAKSPGAPYRFSETRWESRAGAPGLGEHNDDLLGDRLPDVDTILEKNSSSSGSSASEDTVIGSKAPLEGVRVLELSTGIAGPYLCRMMAYHGAEVIRVETTERPENVRMYVPSYDPKSSAMSDMHPGLQEWHGGKLFLGVDLNKREGKDLLHELLRICDVIVINYSAAAVKKLELEYEVLQRVNPSLIWIGMFGYGSTGPQKDYVAWGPQVEAMCGIGHLTALPGGVPARGVFYPDYVAAFHGIFAIMAALIERNRSGRSQSIELSMLEATVATIGPIILDQTVNGNTQDPLGNKSRVMAPHGCYPCIGSDAWCVIAVENDEQWQNLCVAIGHPEIMADSRFEYVERRLKYQDLIDEILSQWTRKRSPVEVVAVLQEAGVPAGMVQTVADMVERDDHLKSREYLMEMDHQRLGQVYATGLAVRLTDPGVRARRTGVNLGGDNDHIVGNLLGYVDQVDDMRASNVIEALD